LCQTIGIGQVPLSFIHQSETVALSLENYRADPGYTLTAYWTAAGDEYAFYRGNLNNVMT